MAEKYFEKFQTISYNNVAVRNITQRAILLNSVYNNPLLYYQYDIDNGERPDTIADRYYQDEYMGWLLKLSNNIIDPYYDWYIDTSTFDAFITKKYQSYERAVTKIKYYRNNWYNSDPIGVNVYDALSSSLKRFYEPLYSDVYYTKTPLSYKRKEADWKKSTNSVVKYTANGTNFVLDEIVDIYRNNVKRGLGQVCGKSNTSLIIQHVSGDVNEYSNPYSFTAVGRESSTNVSFTSSVLLVNNIPSEETTYWDPVTYYDYENDINENNKSIKVVKSNYSTQLADELRNLLK